MTENARRLSIAILDDYQRVARSMADWASLDADIAVFDAPLGDEAAIAAALRDFDIVCLMRERTAFPASLIERLPRLRLIVTSGGRNAAIDVAAAGARGVTVCGTAGSGPATAELTWGLIIALLRHIPAEAASMRAGGWQTALGRELNGRTLGLIGLGRLGGSVARVARAFDMRVLAWSHSLSDGRAAECGAERVALDALLGRADVVSIHTMLSARTRGLLGARELGLMRRDAVLINTSRGPIVDEAALIDCLRARRIAGAGLDVYDREPLPADHPLRRLDNVLLTPHIGYVTEEAYRLFYGQMVEDIAAWRAGAPVRVIA